MIVFNFYDLDSQGGTLHQSKKNLKAKVSIVDTPGALQEELVEWLKSANLVIVPTRTTSRDIEPLQRMRKIISVNTKAPVLYVLNCCTRWTASRDFLTGFRDQVDEKYIITIPQSESFV